MTFGSIGSLRCLWKFRNVSCSRVTIWTGERSMVQWIIKMLERSTPMLSQNIEAKVDFFGCCAILAESSLSTICMQSNDSSIPHRCLPACLCLRTPWQANKIMAS